MNQSVKQMNAIRPVGSVHQRLRQTIAPNDSPCPITVSFTIQSCNTTSAPTAEVMRSQNSPLALVTAR